MRQMNHIASSIAHMQAWGAVAEWWDQGKDQKGKGKGKGKDMPPFGKGGGPWIQGPYQLPAP